MHSPHNSYYITLTPGESKLIDAIIDVFNSEWKEVNPRKALSITRSQYQGNIILLIEPGRYQFAYLKKRIEKKAIGVTIVKSININKNIKVLAVIRREEYDDETMSPRSYKRYIVNYQ